ncbi:MAG TPA: glycogen debranching N-terminal domain-containing protein [Acidimicrobiales bacterium]|nr:glycogen debranching N-terminal domain-containing protein [Acidimicrobiales bacterium]
MEISVGPPVVSTHFDDEIAICELSGEMSSTKEQGYFADDTRLVSGYRLKLGGGRAVLLNGAAVDHHSARFEFTNTEVDGCDGKRIPEHCLHLRLDRSVGPGIHEDYDLTNQSRVPIVVDLEVSIESDFADLFDVKAHRRIRRGSIHSLWNNEERRLTTTYHNETFERALVLEVLNNDSSPEFANGGIRFQVAIAPHETWHCCLWWMPVIDGEERRITRPCHDLIDASSENEMIGKRWIDQATNFDTSNSGVTAALHQAIDDLAGLRLYRHDALAAPGTKTQDLEAWVPAAGIPWFVSLFGRDALIVSLQTLALSPRFALGSLRALASLQADSYDDLRDMQPGKIEHEVRHGELAALRLTPHTPYYGAHETTPLFVLVAARSWRWHGDRRALETIRPHVERALAWIDTDGDIDGDGLQEYQARAPSGYRDQGWKDSGDAIVMSDGSRAKLPVALVEHQGIVVAAKREWAEVVERAFGDISQAKRLREEADRLAVQIEQRFWWESEGTYYLGLDGDKRPIDSVSSNPGHLLWLGVVERSRAARVVERLMAPDMWSGWGIRTLSANHIAYDPLSYQRGSVWPHDNAIAAAGFQAYGHGQEAAKVARGIFDAASMFAAQRLPELFAGFTRDRGAFPVQYLGANVPQAWSSGAIVHLVSTLLGLDPDAQDGAVRLRPTLPAWMDEVTLRQLRIGESSLDLQISQRPDGEHELKVLSNEDGLLVEMIDAR